MQIKFPFSRPITTRARIAEVVAILLTASISYPLVRLYIFDPEFQLGKAAGDFSGNMLAEVFTLSFAFFVVPFTIVLILLQRLLLTEGDFRYTDSAWKQRIEDFFRFRVGYWKMLATLLTGIAITILVDTFITSTVFPSTGGWIARTLSDIGVLVFSMGVLVAWVFRRH